MIKHIILALLLAALLLGAFHIGGYRSTAVNYQDWAKLAIFAAFVLVFYLKDFKIIVNVSVPEKAIKVFVDINKIETLRGDGQIVQDVPITKSTVNPWGDVTVGENNLMEVS